MNGRYGRCLDFESFGKFLDRVQLFDAGIAVATGGIAP